MLQTVLAERSLPAWTPLWKSVRKVVGDVYPCCLPANHPRQVFGCISAYPSARVSDHTGRKPMVALACGGIIAVYLLFCFVDDLRLELVIGGIYGFFNGSFLSVDYALALDTVPSKDDAARWLAVWGVGGFLGTSMGPLISGPVLMLWPGPRQTETGVERNPLGAYQALLVSGAAWMALSAFFLTFIDVERAQLHTARGRRSSDGDEGGDSLGAAGRGVLSGDSPEERLHLVPGQGVRRGEGVGGIASAPSDNALVAHEGLLDGVVVGGSAGTEGLAVVMGGFSRRHGSPLRHRSASSGAAEEVAGGSRGGAAGGGVGQEHVLLGGAPLRGGGGSGTAAAAVDQGGGAVAAVARRVAAASRGAEGAGGGGRGDSNAEVVPLLAAGGDAEGLIQHRRVAE